MTSMTKFAAGDEPADFSVEKFPFEYLVLGKRDFHQDERSVYPKTVGNILDCNLLVSVSNMSPYETLYVDREINHEELDEIKREGYQIYRKL